MPEFDVITPATRLQDQVRRFWPHRKLSVAAAEAIRRKFDGWGEDQINAAIQQFYETDPDANRPDWSEIGRFLRRNGSVLKARDDGADYIRAWWRTWNGRVSWASEILNRDEDAPGTVEGRHFQVWSDTWQLVALYEHRCLGQAWREPNDTRLDTGLPPGRKARRAMLRTAYEAVRKLVSFGPVTDRARDYWRDELEADATRGNVKLPSFDPVETSPF